MALPDSDALGDALLVGEAVAELAGGAFIQDIV